MNCKIQIPSPCSESWNKMTPQKEGRLCEACETTVVDFSSKTLEEIKTYFETPREHQVCGRYRERHINDTTWNRTLNYVETFFSQLKLAKFALGLIAILLFISGCHRRHIQGKMRISKGKSVNRSEQTEHGKGIK